MTGFDFQRVIIRNVTEIASKIHMSDVQIAEAIGVSRQHYNQVKLCKLRLYVEMLYKLATALGVSVDELIKHDSKSF